MRRTKVTIKMDDELNRVHEFGPIIESKLATGRRVSPEFTLRQEDTMNKNSFSQV